MGKDVFVVGAGVIGLSTAIRALEAGLNVTIFAETFPGDKKSIKYTSCWAAANHVSVAATNALLHHLERETLPVFLGLIKEDPLVPVMVRPHRAYSQVFGSDDQKQNDHLSECYSDFRTLKANELPDGVAHGAVFSTVCIDVPRYLPYLMNRFLSGGGRAFRVTLPSLSALLSAKDRPDLVPFPPTSTNTPPSFDPVAIINCTGIGAFSMGDVKDTNVYPTRGEVLIIRAPWISHGLFYFFKDNHMSYIIPRQSGDVILGGTFQVDDWHPVSRPETIRFIKERGIEAYPELLPLSKREMRNIEDLDVVEECVGLRPTRKGGVRAEVTSLHVGAKIFPIVHNYGHGGAGYQSSWGSARLAVELLKSVLE
ncbi:D-amino-acid oxidase [Mycena maculata]|uniref:D-amino-acid oxidase n=1 Tax=Mycena maculata TaxID=230809 RepID=A0AAD7MUF6_9AGAR|nr:D-amino-acid oxidase [Mycena maculata]